MDSYCDQIVLCLLFVVLGMVIFASLHRIRLFYDFIACPESSSSPSVLIFLGSAVINVVAMGLLLLWDSMISNVRPDNVRPDCRDYGVKEEL